MKFEEAYQLTGRAESGEWMGDQDSRVIFDCVREVKNGLIVELGVWEGKSAKLMALASPTSRVIGVDSYQGKFGSGLRIALEAVAGFSISLIKDTTQNVGYNWSIPIDFLHIDADHHYKSVIEDIETWVPHVKQGHYILLHDCAVNEEPGFDKGLIKNPDYGVKRAVELLKDKYFSGVNYIHGFAVCKKL